MHYFLDKRVRVIPCQKERIRRMATNGFSLSSMAAIMKVSPMAIHFILNPDKEKENRKRRKERGGEKNYYDTDLKRVYQRRYRLRQAHIKAKGFDTGTKFQ